MSATKRSSGFPRVISVLAPLFAVTLGGCVAVPLLELAASMPTSKPAPCVATTSGDPAPGCNTSAYSSMIPGMASLMQVIAPAASLSH